MMNNELLEMRERLDAARVDALEQQRSVIDITKHNEDILAVLEGRERRCRDCGVLIMRGSQCVCCRMVDDFVVSMQVKANIQRGLRITG